MVDAEIPDSGAVFTFGKSKFAENTPSKFWIKRDKIVALSCGDEHTAVATKSGRLFTFGSNEYGQLGLGHYDNVLRPSCVKCIKPDRVLSVACGKTHTIIATESGRLFAFGSNNEGQLGIGLNNGDSCAEPMEIIIQQKGTVVDLIQDPIVKLAAGSMHSIALTRSGSVYVWGSNKEGQLGLGDEAEEISYTAERLVIDSNDSSIKDISCGYYHTALVTHTGVLYTFGEADGGKLGLGEIGNNNQDTVDLPSKVDVPEKVCSVSCGGDHTVALSEDGNVYVFGQSTNGQLGLGTRTLETSHPLKITSLSELCNGINKIVQISCGENHTTVVSSGGQLFTFGDGRHGKLCLDTETLSNHYTPVLSTRFRDYRVVSAHCGGCHTMVVAQPLPPDKRLSSIAENEDSSDVIEGTGNIENDQNNSQDTSVSVNGLGSMPIPAIGIHKDINVEARIRHRLASDQKLPPIRGHRLEGKKEDIIDADNTSSVQSANNEGQEESEDDSESISHEVNGSIDEENGDGHSGQDIKAKLDESEPDVNSDKVKSRGFVGFFKKFSTKKSTDTCAKNENDTSTDQDTEQLEEDNNETLKPSVDKSNKDETKHSVSFFRKIGFKKKTPEEIDTAEQKTDDDQASNSSLKNTIKEEDDDDTSSDEDSEVDKPEESNDGINNTKDHNGKTTNENKIEKHVRIMEKENSEIVSSSEIETSDNTEKKKSDAKKSKFCVLL